MREAQAVLAANGAFYAAFADRDLAAMDALWAFDAPVACVHPGWRALRGRSAVMASWQAILQSPNAPDIACVDPRATVLGDTAFVICTERVPGAELVATNVFVRELGEWRLVHHHAGPITAGDDDEPSEELH